MARTDVSMPDREISEFLASGWNLQVATLGVDGYPHVTTLWYVLLDDRITFRSFSRSQRIANLRRDSRLTVLVEEGDSYENLRGVMVKGRARLIDDRPTVLDVYGRVAVKYQGGGTAVVLDPDALEVVFGKQAAKNTAVIVEPVQVISWDHRRLGEAM